MFDLVNKLQIKLIFKLVYVHLWLYYLSVKLLDFKILNIFFYSHSVSQVIELLFNKHS